MAYKEAVDALVHHVFLGRDDDLLADDRILSLVGAVLRAVADGQRVDARLAEEVDGIHRIGVGGGAGKDMVLDAG